MRIDEIQLKNFKNVGELTANFKPVVNLFVGINGSGKTGLLEALCVAVGAFFGSQSQKLQRVIEFDEIKITGGLREPSTTVTAFNNIINKSWSRTIRRDTKTNDSKYIQPASNYGKQFFDMFNNSDDRTVAPIIAYYSSQRLYKDAKKSQYQIYDPNVGRNNGYIQCLEDKAIKPLLMEWLSNAVTRRATLQIKEINQIDNVLENVEQAIHLLLVDFLELPDDFSLKVYPDSTYNNELFLQYDLADPLPLAYYSDGFRNLLFLIIDIVWRASQLNPWLAFRELKENIFGVVMIDEIDLHLHPRWQGKAIGLLQTLFPHTQFFITTHSPTVVANFTNGQLYIIEQNQIFPCDEKYFGKEVNSVLKNILKAPDRHIETQAKLDTLFMLIDEEKENSEIDPLLNELIILLGKEDREIQRAVSLHEWNVYKNNNKTHAIHP